MLGDLDWGPVFAGYLAAMLLGGAYLSIGLYASAKTDNQIVALILTTFGCGAFYLVGSPFVLDLVGNAAGDVLRGLGAGSRFESITRGVIDFRDLYFYLSVSGAFLTLSMPMRWTRRAGRRTVTASVIRLSGWQRRFSSPTCWWRTCGCRG